MGTSQLFPLRPVKASVQMWRYADVLNMFGFRLLTLPIFSIVMAIFHPALINQYNNGEMLIYAIQVCLGKN